MTSAHEAERQEAIASEERAMLDAYAVLVENLIDLIADWENRAARQSAEANQLLKEDPDDNLVESTEVRRIGNYYRERVAELKKAMV